MRKGMKEEESGNGRKEGINQVNNNKSDHFCSKSRTGHKLQRDLQAVSKGVRHVILKQKNK